MDTSDTPQAGPLTLDQAVDNAMAPGAGQAELETAAPEAPEAEEIEDTLTEEPEADQDEAPQVLTVDEYGDVLVDLGEERVSLAEIAKGNLRQQDYTRKTQELAREREEIKRVQEELAAKQAQLDAAVLSDTSEEQEPDWEKLYEEDPLGFPLVKTKWDKRQAAKRAEREAAEKRLQERQQAFIAQTAEKALEVFPEWAETGKFEANEPARRDAALAAGFTAHDYQSALDNRFAVLLEWAALGRAKAQKVTDKKVGKAPKVVKPGRQKAQSERAAERQAEIKKALSRPHTIEEALKVRGY